MTYKPLLAVQIADPRDVYGDVTAPTVTFSETMREANRLDTVTRSGVRYDEALSCLYLEPQYAPVSETLGDWTTTSGHTFKAVKHAVSETNVIKHTAWASGHETEEWVAYRGTGTAFGEGSGYWIALYMDAPKPGTTRTADDIYVTAGFAAVSSLAYRVKWAFGLAPRLERTIDGGTNWLAVADLPMGDGGTSTTGSGGELILQVLKMNGSLIFRAGQAVNAMAETGVAVPSMAVNFPITVTGKGCHAAFGAWPVTWPTSGVFVSDESPKPWYNTTTPVITVDGSASGITAAMTTSGTDWTLQYSLTLAPTSAVSPCVRQVKIYIPVVQSNPSAIPPWATLSGVYGFELNHAFDPVETSVHISGHVRVRNHEGQYGSAYGERACPSSQGTSSMACRSGNPSGSWESSAWTGNAVKRTHI